MNASIAFVGGHFKQLRPLNFHVSLLKRLGLVLFLHLLGRKELWHLFCYSLQQILRVGSSQ